MTTLSDAQQGALAAEHRAVFGYGTLGAHLNGAARSAARTAQVAHQALRDQLTDALTRAGVDPVAAQVDYPGLYPLRSTAEVLAAATSVEVACAAAWRYVYAVGAARTGSAATAARALAQTGLTGGAVRATHWRVAAGAHTRTVPFPGI